MSGHEVNIKVDVDSSQLDEVIEKAKQLKEALWVVNGLIEELTDTNTVEITIETIRYSFIGLLGVIFIVQTVLTTLKGA